MKATQLAIFCFEATKTSCLHSTFDIMNDLEIQEPSHWTIWAPWEKQQMLAIVGTIEHLLCKRNAYYKSKTKKRVKSTKGKSQMMLLYCASWNWFTNLAVLWWIPDRGIQLSTQIFILRRSWIHLGEILSQVSGSWVYWKMQWEQLHLKPFLNFYLYLNDLEARTFFNDQEY